MRGLLRMLLLISIFGSAATFGMYLFKTWFIAFALSGVDAEVAFVATSAMNSSLGAPIGIVAQSIVAAVLLSACVVCTADDRRGAATLVGIATLLHVLTIAVAGIALRTDAATTWPSLKNGSLWQSGIGLVFSAVAFLLLAASLWSAARARFMSR